MPRDSNGNYTLPSGNPVVSGTTISSAGWAIPTLNDIAAMLTDSLSRSGAGGMLTGFKITDGSAASPGLAFTNEPTTGFYRMSSNSVGATVAGVARWSYTPQVFVMGALQLQLSAPAIGGPSILANGTIVTNGPAANNSAVLNSTLAGSPGYAGGYQLHLGLNLAWSGTSWVTGTDGGSNGGAAITSAYNPGNLNFYTAVNTGGTNQSITNANLLTNNLRMQIGASGGVAISNVGSGLVGLNVVGNGNTPTAPALLVQANNTLFSAPMLALRSSNASGQMPLDFQIGAVTYGRIRCDYGGNMTYVSTGGVHSWSVGADPASGGTVALTITANGALNISGAASAAVPNLVVSSQGNTHSAQIQDSAGNQYNVGYLGAPFTTFGANYTALLSDRGKTLSPAAGGLTLTINPSLYTAGDVFIVENFSGGNLTIGVSTNALYWVGTGATGARTLATNGRCTVSIRPSGNASIAGINLT